MNTNLNDPTLSSSGQAIDLTAHPLTWAQVIQSMPDRVRELEVGSGKGLFLQTAAQADPSRHFVGIELSRKFANRAAQRIFKMGLSNVSLLCGDAKKFLSQVVPDQAVQCVHVYFPDPWWRNKHKKRRVLNEQTLQDIQRVLPLGGQFHFWTDALDYYEHICQEVMQHTQLAGPRYVPERGVHHAMDYTTHFERRARLSCQPVYRAIFEKQ